MGDNKELDIDETEAVIRDVLNDVFSEDSSGKSQEDTSSTDVATDASIKDENVSDENTGSEKKKLFGKKNKKKEKTANIESTDEKEADKEKNKVEPEESIDDYKVDEDGNFIKKKKRKRLLKKGSRKPEDINIVKELLSLIIYFAIVILAVYFILTFVGCKSLVSGPSMNPTLEDMEQVWVDKLTYRFSDPKRFDVIIFNYDEDTTYVKRIIGLPGESVKIDPNGNIYIDGKLMNESYGLERISANKVGRASEPVVLGKNEYFVLGDNRNNSSDSRFADVGNVHKDDIVGKVLIRLSPLKKFGIIK